MRRGCPPLRCSLNLEFASAIWRAAEVNRRSGAIEIALDDPERSLRLARAPERDDARAPRTVEVPPTLLALADEVIE